MKIQCILILFSPIMSPPRVSLPIQLHTPLTLSLEIKADK